MNALVLVLATWRLTYGLIYEQGAFGVFDHARRIANRVGAGDLFACVYCLSVWVGGGLYVLHLSPIHPVNDIFVSALALSAGAVFVDKVHKEFIRR